MDSKEPSKVCDSSLNHSLLKEAESSSSPVGVGAVKITGINKGGKGLSNHTSVPYSSGSVSSHHQKPPKKVAEKVSIDNLPETELKAVLEEAVKYRGKGDQQTELFQALLRETQESGEESPPAFRPTQSSQTFLTSSQQRKRRQKKENSSFPGTPPSVQCSTVAGSNQKGGSLQNISSSHSQNERRSVRQRKRHDTSDSGSALGSPRKREGGSLPCDVARGLKPQTERVPPSHHLDEISSDKDCIINMEGIVTEDRFPEPWNLHLATRNDAYTNSGSFKPMDVELPNEETLLTTTKKSESTYGTCDVDACIPMPLSSTTINNTSSNELEYYRSNGLVSDLPIFRCAREYDENGNPPYGSSPHMFTRTSPSSLMSLSTSAKSLRTTKSKKRSKEDGGVLSDNMPGFRGDKDVDELVEYIQSSEGNKKGSTKASGSKQQNGGTVSGSATSTKSKKTSNKSLRRVLSNEADSEDSSTDEAATPHPLDEEYKTRKNSPFRRDGGVFEEPGTISAAASGGSTSDFQTVTKRQKRKKRNNSMGGRGPTEDGQSSSSSPMGNNLFHNASSPSVLMRPSQQRHTLSSSGTPSGGAGRTSGSSSMMGSEMMKKTIASVPPSEPSDLDSDGGDSVHSLPVQPSAPLYFPPLPSYQHVHEERQTAPPPAISYADIIRAEAKPSVQEVSCSPAPVLSFLAEPSQPVDIVFVQSATSSSNFVPPSPAGVPSSAANRNRSSASGAPLRRAASLPPTSPSQETPVVIVGLTGFGSCSSGAASTLDVTFGFELNEQLLALSLDPSGVVTTTPTPEGKVVIKSGPPPPVDLTLDSFISSSPSSASSSSPTISEPEMVTPPSSPPEAHDPGIPSPVVASAAEQEAQRRQQRTVVAAAVVDFAARYRERPELLNRPSSRRSYEIVDFISQAWKLIERTLDEQQHQVGRSSNSSLQSGGIRVYSLE